MMKNKNKIKVIGIIVAATILIIISYNVYNKYSENKKNVILLSEITEKDKDFNNEIDRDKKLIILKELQEEYSNYKESKENFNEVDSKYESEISTLQDYFINEYDTNIKNNSLENINDKDNINKIKNNLNTLLSNIKSEENITTTQEEVESYNGKINELISLCDNKLKVIQETEAKALAEVQAIAEQKAKEEIAKVAAAEEVKKAAVIAEQKKAATNNNTSNNSNTNTNSNTSNGTTSTNQQNNHGRIVEYTWSLDGNGNKIESSVISHYEDGCYSGIDGVIHSQDEF